MVWDDVAVTAVFVIAVVSGDTLPRLAPIRLYCMPPTNIMDHTVDNRVSGDEGNSSVEQRLDVPLDKGLCLHRCKDLCRVDRFTVMANAGCPAGQISS
jgi:hypothetical protein